MMVCPVLAIPEKLKTGNFKYDAWWYTGSTLPSKEDFELLNSL